MIHFRTLRLQGFKSFVDKTELAIEPGLTGIVGPNGCGKSNLVEALRWVMGENSARRIRGGDMDDVIFAGTSGRPLRNFAEVSLVLDNSDRTGPASHNGDDEIEVLRRIERDQGSAYKINGRPVRARDVQLLFADTVTGANSPALVSQGRVTAVINAKPSERRLILEESAGISGLYARRHEAEIRLRAAETNLTRLQDVLAGFETRLNDLRKQARQATRYKNLSARIRQAEITLAWLEWKISKDRLDTARAAHGKIDSAVAERMAAVTRLTREQTDRATEIPALRQAEVEAAAALQAKKIAIQRLEDEEKHIESLLSESRTSLSQTSADRTRETESLDENARTLERLEIEEKTLLQESAGEDDALEIKRLARDTLEEKAKTLESELSALTAQLADSRAQKEALERQIERDSRQKDQALSRHSQAQDSLTKAEAALSALEGEAPPETEITALENKVVTLRSEIDSATATLDGARKKLEDSRSTRESTEQERSRLEAEARTLRTVLSLDEQGTFRPIMEDVAAAPGFEAALSRALGDTLLASTDPQAPTVWSEKENSATAPALPTLPQGAQPLSEKVKAPKALAAALGAIGIVTDFAAGEALAEHLAPGSALVSPDGHFWRWDGLRIKAAAADRHAAHLRQKNRLAEIDAALPGIAEQSEQKAQALNVARSEISRIEDEIRTLRRTLSETESALSTRRAALSQSFERRTKLRNEIARTGESRDLATAEIERLDRGIEELRASLAGIVAATPDSGQKDMEALRETLLQTRESLREALRAFESARQSRETRRARLQALGDERLTINNRSIRSREHLKTLERRNAELEEKIAGMSTRPDAIRTERQGLLSTIGQVESARTAAADSLAAAEKLLNETNRALKSAESELATLREDRAREQATVAAMQERIEELSRAAEEKFSMPAHALADHLSAPIEQESPETVDSSRAQLEKLIRERDSLGPVNLRADVEAEAVEKESGTLIAERDDLLAAISELRGGIGKLNREARERLSAAFNTVNEHFRTLFTRLFGGGSAHLALIDSDDPLEAGLEIFAQPPGKALQSLSLLSGGEQTLTSIALIFAMFLTNPAPICVLDEIDAPLDDANVDRVCHLLETITGETKTRFLVITHHRLTMARMDRLYGVTMAERGVSQLVSVDLQQSFAFVEAAE